MKIVISSKSFLVIVLIISVGINIYVWIGKARLIKNNQENLLSHTFSPKLTSSTVSTKFEDTPSGLKELERSVSNDYYNASSTHMKPKQIKKLSIDTSKLTASYGSKHNLNICSNEIVKNLATPRLSNDDIKFCQWALDPQGGKVTVGKSWGALRSNLAHREKFDHLSCNTVSNGVNPSCDDSWGDIHIKKWLMNPIKTPECYAGSKSNISCFKNDNNDNFCVLNNAKIDFSQMKKVLRPGQSDSRSFTHDFLTIDCTKAHTELSTFPFPHLFSTRFSTKPCDITLTDTTLLYSHDHIKNFGHTMQDFMNVWVMLWLTGNARNSKSIEMLTVDALGQYNNYGDEINSFYQHYYKNFKGIQRGVDFADKTVCFNQIIIQPKPPRLFVWESWHKDLPCSFVGPSTLYQRWNMHIRNSYNLLSDNELIETNKKIKIVLIVRVEGNNVWGSYRSSRLFLNLPEIKESIQSVITQQTNKIPYEFIVQDLSKLGFKEQVKFLSETSILIGMHGAGIVSAMHMSIGAKYCCGVIEMFPVGEFFPVRGHANMARKMGIHYSRIEISQSNSRSNGAVVPTDKVSNQLIEMINTIISKSSCVHPAVINDPYLEML
eukprot:gene8144-11023_t